MVKGVHIDPNTMPHTFQAKMELLYLIREHFNAPYLADIYWYDWPRLLESFKNAAMLTEDITRELLPYILSNENQGFQTVTCINHNGLTWLCPY